MTDIQTNSSESVAEVPVGVASPAVDLKEEFFGYLYLLPAETKGLVIQTAPDFRITAGLPPTSKDVTTVWSGNFRNKKHTTANLLISHLFRKKSRKSALKDIDDLDKNCSCYDCQLEKENSSANHHIACGCFYCKVERTEDSRDFYLFGVDTTRQDKLIAQPYRISNIYNDGRICFRKKEDYKVRIPLSLREASATFWGTAFDPDFIQAQGSVPHQCLHRQHVFPREHRHLCKDRGHPHEHLGCAPLKRDGLVKEIQASTTRRVALDQEVHALSVKKLDLINKKDRILKHRKLEFISWDSTPAVPTTPVKKQKTTIVITPEQQAEVDALVKEIDALVKEITAKSTEKLQLDIKSTELSQTYHRLISDCHCCQNRCLCASKCPCCRGDVCECFINCKCRCCQLLCGCGCTCNLADQFAEFVAAYQPSKDRWEDFTLYFCGNDFYATPNKVTAAFVGFQRDLGNKIPTETYRTTPGYEKDPFVVGFATLNPETNCWSLEIEKDIKLEVLATQVRVVK